VRAAGEQLTLEAWDGRAWRTTVEAETRADGRVSWSLVLGPGKYRLRARYAGSDTLSPATSRPLTLVVRRGSR
jgi:hypothetical protein